MSICISLRWRLRIDVLPGTHECKAPRPRVNDITFKWRWNRWGRVRTIGWSLTYRPWHDSASRTRRHNRIETKHWPHRVERRFIQSNYMPSHCNYDACQSNLRCPAWSRASPRIRCRRSNLWWEARQTSPKATSTIVSSQDSHSRVRDLKDSIWNAGPSW